MPEVGGQREARFTCRNGAEVGRALRAAVHRSRSFAHSNGLSNVFRPVSPTQLPAGGVTFTPERASLQDQSLPGGPRPRATPGLSKKRSTTRRNGFALRARITHAVYRVTGIVRERPWFCCPGLQEPEWCTWTRTAVRRHNNQGFALHTVRNLRPRHKPGDKTPPVLRPQGLCHGGPPAGDPNRVAPLASAMQRTALHVRGKRCRAAVKEPHRAAVHGRRRARAPPATSEPVRRSLGHWTHGLDRLTQNLVSYPLTYR
jgi:hypothetical protein